MDELDRLRAENRELKNSLAAIDPVMVRFIEIITAAALILRELSAALSKTHPSIANQAAETVRGWEAFIAEVEAANAIARRQTAPSTPTAN